MYHVDSLNSAPVLIIRKTHYYPFGMVQPGRSYSQNSIGYRYGFNGKEKDDEVKGPGDQYDFGSRIYDPRVGRWWSLDPLRQVYTSISAYAFAANNVLNITDIKGQILRDKEGNIIATANATVDKQNNQRVIDYKSGAQLKIEYKYVTIYTDEGNPVTAQIVTKAVLTTKNKEGKFIQKSVEGVHALDVTSNCHGYAFADGKVIITEDESLRTILKEDHYKYLGTNKENSKDADIIVVYRPEVSSVPPDELQEGDIDPGAWDHTAKKELNKDTYTDKDDEKAKRHNLSPEGVANYESKQEGQELIYYKKTADKGGKKVTVTSGDVKDGVRTVDPKVIQNIKKTLDANPPKQQ